VSRLSGTGVLTELAVRTDRVRIPVWTVAIVGFTVLVAWSCSTTYPTAVAREARGGLLSSPAATALAGPGYGLDHYTLGAMVANEVAGMTMVAAAVMSVLIVTRHLRAEEECGRLELVHTGVVGRYASITAGLISAALANVFVGLLLVIGLLAVGLPPVGSLTMSAGVLVVGLVFTAFSALASQFTEHARTASGAGIAAIGVAVALRAVGDVRHEHSGSLFTWVSPLGWSQATRAYVDERWWPLLIGLAASVIFAACAYAAVDRRDVGSGLFPPRRGHARAAPSRAAITALAARGLQAQALVWGLGVFALSLPLGILGQHGKVLHAGATVDEVSAHHLVLLVGLAAAYAVAAFTSISVQESSGRTDEAVVAAGSRTRWFASHVLIIAGAAATITLAAGIGSSLTSAAPIGAALNVLPALFLMVGLGAAVYGLVPRALPLLWSYLGYVLVAELFSHVLPERFGVLSPFHHTPNLPAASLLPPFVLLVSATVLVLAGAAGFRHRDVGRRQLHTRYRHQA
jgi:ABC-2 type transport system permease protein